MRESLMAGRHLIVTYVPGSGLVASRSTHSIVLPIRRAVRGARAILPLPLMFTSPTNVPNALPRSSTNTGQLLSKCGHDAGGKQNDQERGPGGAPTEFAGWNPHLRKRPLAVWPDLFTFTASLSTSTSHSGSATQRRDWRCAPPPSPPRSMITATSSHKRLIPSVGMPLLSSHAYTIAVSGRKMKPSTGSTRPPWNARCR